MILLVRVAERPREKPARVHRSASLVERRRPGDRLAADDEIDVIDPRVVRKQNRRPGAADVHYRTCEWCAAATAVGVHARSEVHFLPESDLEEYRRGGPTNHGGGGPGLFHVRRRVAPRRGNRAGFDDPIFGRLIGTG